MRPEMNMEELLKVLSQVRDDIDFAADKDLVTGGKLTSLDILQIITALNDEFDISVPAALIMPENFNSAEKIWEMVQKLEEE